MKTIVLSRTIFIFLIFTLLSFTDPYTVKRISDKDFRYEFYTTEKKIKPLKSKMYSWFKGGLVHESQGGIAGDLLNDKFIKMYHSNQLAEQGNFKNGLRIGEWKTWHSNGILATHQTWNNGLRSGNYLRYDVDGNLVEKGKFINNYKTGKWTNTETEENAVYRKGIIVKEKEIITKSEKYRIKQENIKLENTQENQKQLEAASDAMKLKAYKAKTKEEKALAKEKAAKKVAREQAKNESKKDSKIKTFFNTLFKKKDKAPK